MLQSLSTDIAASAEDALSDMLLPMFTKHGLQDTHYVKIVSMRFKEILCC